MTNLISLAGQWLGYFAYGPEYGEKLYGEKVQFRLFLEDAGNGQFKGKCIDLEGIGSNFEPPIITGFLNGTFISFTKEYSTYYSITETGEKIDHTNKPLPRISYSGEFDKIKNSFFGKWELWSNETLYRDGSIVEIVTGEWEMHKDD